MTTSKWQAAPLGELCSVTAGGTPLRSKTEFWGGGVPWVKISDMLQGEIKNTDEQISQLGLENSSAKLLPAGTLLLSIFATVGRTAILGIEAATNQAIVGLTIKNKAQLDQSFLRRFLEMKSVELEAKARGVAQTNINGSILKAVSVPLPAVSEQQRIVEVLDRAETLRAKRRAVLVQFDSIIESMFFDLFGKSTTRGTKFPCSSLGMVAKFIDYRGISPNKQSSGVRLVTAKNIKRGWFAEEPQEFIPSHEYTTWMRRGIPCTGDVLFTTEGHTLGSAAQLPHFEKAALAQRLIALQPREQLSSEYLLHVILSSEFQNEVLRRATGSAARGISSKALAEISISIPPLPLQRQFSQRVKIVEKLKKAAGASLRELDALFATLQYRAFRGQL